jgi:hypothetical protein
LKIIFEKGIAQEDIIATLNVLTTHSPQIAKASNFFAIKSARFSTNIFCSTSSFLKGSFEAKIFNMEEMEIRDLFFVDFFQHFFSFA